VIARTAYFRKVCGTAASWAADGDPLPSRIHGLGGTDPRGCAHCSWRLSFSNFELDLTLPTEITKPPGGI
jgi:hypothetical protein